MRPMYVFAVRAAAAVWLIGTSFTPSHATSFNCSRASNDAEYMICGNRSLSELDDELATAFDRARRQSANPAQLALEERSWLLRRNECRNVGCIAQEYQNRISALSSPSSNLNGFPSRGGGGTEIQLLQDGGTLTVPVFINNAITLDFTIDSGASDVSIPADVVMTLVRTGTITDDDFLGKRTYRLADGSTVPSQTFRIRSLKVGNKILQNVTASIASANSSLLLGQSFLSRFRSWSINNERGVLTLE